jgi:hypothetical protein
VKVRRTDVGLVYKSYSQKAQEALILFVTEERYWALFYMPLYTYLHNLPNVLVQTANQMSLEKHYFIGDLVLQNNRYTTLTLLADTWSTLELWNLMQCPRELSVD